MGEVFTPANVESQVAGCEVKLSLSAVAWQARCSSEIDFQWTVFSCPPLALAQGRLALLIFGSPRAV